MSTLGIADDKPYRGSDSRSAGTSTCRIPRAGSSRHVTKTRATRYHKREFTRIGDSFDGHEAHGGRHTGIHDVVNTGVPFVHTEAEGLGQMDGAEVGLDVAVG
jgi:hypothetical protein